ncbi:hypothetical protein Tsubulata_028430 [Turnera subulata]|uniref:CCT domain-containing protein n=1 Tax=Turnera subulata TaxID=218843 RepID=A0A9Q0FQ50_9ROSI|nr:hypothetical protein Tsubulata_028430 [Turnera subulata]
MASIPHFCSDYQFSPDEFAEIMAVMTQENYNNATFSSTINSSAGAMSYHGTMTRHEAFHQMPYGEIPDVASPASGISFPERLGISDMSVPTLMDYNKAGSSNGSSFAKIQNYGGGFQLSDTWDYGEECCGLMANFRPLGPSITGENWGTERGMAGIEPNNVRVGRYTVEERKDRILRYLKKRNQRNFNKTIKYACRKTLADRRVRVRGRFARNNEIFDEEAGVKENNDNLHQDKESHCSDSIQIKNDEDEWLQEAMASMMYVPYIAG